MSEVDKSDKSVSTDKRLARREEFDRLFMRHYLSNGGNGQAAYQACRPGTPDRQAQSRASKVLKRIRQSVSWEEIMAEAGLDNLSLAAKARELLSARSTVIDSDGEEHEVEDKRVQLGALQLAGKWQGKEKAAPVEIAPIEIRITHDTEGI